MKVSWFEELENRKAYLKKNRCANCGNKTVEARVMKWIDYEEKMPDKDGVYITVCRGSVRILNFARDLRAIDKYDFTDKDYPGWYAYDEEYGNYEVVGVTHWAPQPEMPKELGGLG